MLDVRFSVVVASISEAPVSGTDVVADMSTGRGSNFRPSQCRLPGVATSRRSDVTYRREQVRGWFEAALDRAAGESVSCRSKSSSSSCTVEHCSVRTCPNRVNGNFFCS
jgi:hypothetical protein